MREEENAVSGPGIKPFPHRSNHLVIGSHIYEVYM